MTRRRFLQALSSLLAFLLLGAKGGIRGKPTRSPGVDPWLAATVTVVL